MKLDVNLTAHVITIFKNSPFSTIIEQSEAL